MKMHPSEQSSRSFHAKEEYDARGLYVSPGWIDLHTHVYEHATQLGVNVDQHCLAKGNILLVRVSKE